MQKRMVITVSSRVGKEDAGMRRRVSAELEGGRLGVAGVLS